MNTQNRNIEALRNAVYRAVALSGKPVGYDEILRECKTMSPESVMRWLRDEEIRNEAGIIKTDRGEYTVVKLQKIGALGRFC